MATDNVTGDNGTLNYFNESMHFHLTKIKKLVNKRNTISRYRSHLLQKGFSPEVPCWYDSAGKYLSTQPEALMLENVII
ncbi:hypothetical protein [Citrobacter sp. VF227]